MTTMTKMDILSPDSQSIEEEPTSKALESALSLVGISGNGDTRMGGTGTGNEERGTRNEKQRTRN